MSQIESIFCALPYKQLAIVGGPGAGKSVLSLLLTLGLLDERATNEPVPVLLEISSWNPTMESINAWIARSINEKYGRFDRQVGDYSIVDQLLTQGRLLPVLDGLDELPTSLLSKAIEALDRLMAQRIPLVVACRTLEFEQTVGATGVMFSQAAVVEIEPVATDQIIEFLAHPAPTRDRWLPVMENLRRFPRGSIAQAFSTPFMLQLARVAYRRPGTDPSDLLAKREPVDVSNALLSTFMNQVFLTNATDGVRASRQYVSERATRWLTFLAYQMSHLDSHELRWWQIRPGTMSRSPILANLLATVTVATLIVGLTWISASHVGNPDFAMRLAFVVFVIASSGAMSLFRSFRHGGYPPYVPSRYRPPKLSDRYRMRVRISFWLLFGMMTGILIDDVLFSTVVGTLGGIVDLSLPNWPRHVGRRPASPLQTLRAGQRHALFTAARCGLIAGTIFAAAAVVAPSRAHGTTAAIVASCVYGAAAANAAGLWFWIYFRTACAILAARGWLPWRLWRFVNDARKRAVLRQSGTAWQFRHDIFREYLAFPVLAERLQKESEGGSKRAKYELHSLLIKHGGVAELRRLADSGDREAAGRLADLLASRGLIDELRARADGGDSKAATRLVDLLLERHREDDAIAILRGRADGGDSEAATRLVDLLLERHREDDAIAILRGRADGDRDAAWRLAQLLAGQSRSDDAMAVLRAWADAQDVRARSGLADLLVQESRVEELRSRADAGDNEAASRLAHVLFRLGDIDELEARAEAGGRDAVLCLAELLERQGRIDEAVAVLDTHSSDWRIAEQLASLLIRHGNVEMLKARVNAGDMHAAIALANLLVEQGRAQDGLAMLWDFGIRTGKWSFDFLELLYEHGSPSEQIAFLRPYADAGEWYAVREFPELLAKHGRIGELRWRANRGSVRANQKLVSILVRDDNIEELRARADSGDAMAAQGLADLLVDLGRIDELHARAEAGDHASTQRLRRLRLDSG